MSSLESEDFPRFISIRLSLMCLEDLAKLHVLSN